MTDLQFTVRETIYRQYGRLMEITYQYDEIRTEQVEENMQVRQEKLEKHYQASIKRDEYERIADTLKYQRNILPFDTFIQIVQPFMMGTYTADEIREAFRLLDSNYSKTIDLDELSAFIPVIHPNMSKETVLSYITKVSHNGKQEINFNEFIQMVLQGVARDIVCGHV
ncbi:unnamed protein product [Rotaria sp. Silwood2]|nr:unnamed protein product [Rotaria sp. Silwood2]CAF2825994.1 unnamed protein product [Rotaria sp. Silwood2]CAF2986989.1 unnamed protein product [Rotaria sp. Silwood2]CAF3197235.1 unnamed protein product [Rotaria sp. Silwood2]CAF3893012.1 unnamed protein product [Rotaria sp. Silwood2]